MLGNHGKQTATPKSSQLVAVAEGRPQTVQRPAVSELAE